MQREKEPCHQSGTHGSTGDLQRINEALADCTAELTQREALLRILAANVQALFAHVDAGEVFRYVNPPYEERYERPVAEIVGRTLRELLGEEVYAQALPYVAGVLAGRAQRYEYDMACQGGTRTLSVLYVPDKDGEGRTRGFFSLTEDVSEHDELERILRVNEQRLSAIVRTAADGILTIDEAGTVADFNPAAERIFELPATAIVGRPVSALLAGGADHLGSGPDAKECCRELTGLRGDGSRFPLEITVASLETQGLRVAFIRDLTERKALEREIIEATTEEQARIGREIHDGIGQHLTALSLLAGSVERKLSAAGWDKEAAVVGSLVGHLQETLGEARALARGLSPVEMDPEGLAQALFDLTEKVVATAGLECRFLDVGGVEVFRKNTALHLYRIAQEAVHNAVRHGRPQHIEVRLEQEGRHLTLSVRDDGRGFQGRASSAERLGLRIMRYRTGILGGTLTLEEAPGGGTVVRCVVPAEE